MQICRSISEIRAQCADWRQDGATLALVPTMGALHDGHMALVGRAREWVDARGGGRVVASVFVNPTQFGPDEDLDRYPRDEAGDLAKLRAAGVDAAFLPDPAEIYRPGAETFVECSALSHMLMGRLRPGHFRGVTTIVTKLFNIIQPDAACFGEKDYQQLVVIRRMVSDLNAPIDILGVPTVREPDGLAMSSRNQRLSPADRRAATVLSRALAEAENRVASGTTTAALRRQLRDIITAEARADIRSIDIRHAETLAPINGTIQEPAVILLAAQFGDVLLIDQRVTFP